LAGSAPFLGNVTGESFVMSARANDAARLAARTREITGFRVIGAAF
jgi:hypothetical protein